MPSPAVKHPGACGCHCREVGGNASRAGAVACEIGVEMVVEQFPPCGDGDHFLHLGEQCLQLGSEALDVTLLETNVGTVGPISRLGDPKECIALGILGAQDLTLHGALDTAHGNFDFDVANVFRLVCE
jgi:hypothetical protein